MLARYLRLMLLLELAAYVAIAWWLHFLLGWSYAWLALAAASAAIFGRLAMVCITATIAFAAGAPAIRAHPLGFGATAALVLREWLAVLATNFFCFPWDRLALRRDPEPAPSATIPVVMVHGYFSNRGYFRALVRALEARGIGPVFAPNFIATFATIEEFVVDLEREIERIALGTGQPQVILVCHSMGGLAARAYLCAKGSERVRKLITIASPHHGTVQARFGAGQNARQMHPGSAFLGELCDKEAARAPECGVTSIYTLHDNLVSPQETSRLAWAKNVTLTGYGHLDILRSRRLAELLVEELRDCGVRPSA